MLSAKAEACRGLQDRGESAGFVERRSLARYGTGLAVNAPAAFRRGPIASWLPLHPTPARTPRDDVEGQRDWWAD